MKCSNCGHEIEEGKLYCGFCGKAVQVVPDYNVLDEEILASFIHHPDDRQNEKEYKANDAVKHCGNKNKTSCKNGKRYKKRKRIFLLCFALVAFVAVVSILMYLHSGMYYYKVAQKLDGQKEYVDALSYYEKSTCTYPVKARVGMGRDYYLLQDYDEAETVLLEALDLDADYTETYRNLLRVYAATEQYDKIDALKEDVSSQKILKLFSDYVTATVNFSKEAGEYEDDLSLELSAPVSYSIYYTLDGTNPTGSDGILYENPIALTDGTTTVKAVCKDSSGQYGAVSSNRYCITYTAPDYPLVTPSSGTYHEETQITMTAEDGANIYYTWDESIPSAASDEYIEPITIPEGNHVLSVIVVDDHGMTSDILKMNYQYLP